MCHSVLSFRNENTKSYMQLVCWNTLEISRHVLCMYRHIYSNWIGTVDDVRGYATVLSARSMIRGSMQGCYVQV
jgi:hypothetical protein